jgi:hypothetical protein
MVQKRDVLAARAAWDPALLTDVGREDDAYHRTRESTMPYQMCLELGIGMGGRSGRRIEMLTKVEAEPCVETSHTVCPDDVPHSLKVARRFCQVNSFTSSNHVFQLTSDLFQFR